MALVSADVAARVEATRAQFRLDGDCVVAFSGGLDSTVLLHMLVQAGAAGLRAVHIDHGLQGPQPDWRRHVTDACAALRVSLKVIELHLAPQSGQSTEALAREARYAALSAQLKSGDLLLLGQHRDDQAETLLLQLLRGSGPAGLAAMPQVAVLGNAMLMRPLLDVPVCDLRDYADQQGLDWFDDPSNADERFDRNYLRRRVMPVIAERWPSMAKTLARAARHQADSMHTAAAQAASDARMIGLQAGRLSISRLLRLSGNRQRNVLRFALRAGGLSTPPESRMRSVLALCHGASGRGEITWDQVVVRRYRDGLYLMAPPPALPREGFTATLSVNEPLPLPAGTGVLRLMARAAVTADVPVFRCAFRSGGERVRVRSDGPSCSLAQWFQRHDVPPWERSRTPLLFIGDMLVAVGEHALAGFEPFQQVLELRWDRAASGAR